MRAIVLEALRAGALGFSTSRTMGHRAIDGELVPGTYAAEDELFGIGSALGEAGTGVFELAPLGSAGEMLQDAWHGGGLDAPALGRHRPARVLRAAPDTTTTPSCGASSSQRRSTPAPRAPSCYPQIAGRPTGILSGHHTTFCLFRDFPAYQALRAEVLVGRRAGRRAGRPRGAAVDRVVDAVVAGPGGRRWRRPTGAPSCWATRRTTSPGRSSSLAGLAAARGVSPLEVAYDELARDGGQGLLYIPILNYATGDLDHVRDMMLHPQGLIGLADGGAHTGTICDASMPTFMLTHWTRDRSRGATLPLEYVVKKQTHDTARLYGMSDRGTVEPGALADFNLIDYDGLSLGAPFVAGRPARGRAPAAPEGLGLRAPRSRRGRSRSSRARRPASCPGAWSEAHADLTALCTAAPHGGPVRHGRLQSVWRHRGPSTRCATTSTSATRCGGRVRPTRSTSSSSAAGS